MANMILSTQKKKPLWLTIINGKNEYTNALQIQSMDIKDQKKTNYLNLNKKKLTWIGPNRLFKLPKQYRYHINLYISKAKEPKKVWTDLAVFFLG